MVTNGRVVGGHYLNAAVTTAPIGSGLVIQSGLKWRKLDEQHVAEWAEVVSESNSGTISAVGQAIAGAVLPRFMSKSASAAVGATLDTTNRPPHIVRIDWADGKQSLVKLPDKLFIHMELMLKDRRAAESVRAPASSVAAGVALAPATPPTVTEQAFSLVSGLIKDRKAAPPIESTAAGEPDVAELLVKLASLRSTGVLTEEEFTAKKAELLSRM